MLQSLSIVLLFAAAACTSESAHTPSKDASLVGPSASAADVTVSVDSSRETRKEGDVKVGQSFAVSIVGTPGVTWKAADTDRSLGAGTPVPTIGASRFRWTSKMSPLQAGDHTLHFEGSNGKTLTVVVHVE